MAELSADDVGPASTHRVGLGQWPPLGHLVDGRAAGVPPPDCLQPDSNTVAFKTIPTRPTAFTTKPARAAGRFVVVEPMY